MHPTAALILCVLALLGIQWFSVSGMGVSLVVLLLFFPGARSLWWRFIGRARWLLLTLWLVMSYGTPGEALAELAWLPTLEGLAEANVQALRFIVSLGVLAAFLATCPAERLLAALWGAMLPLRYLGVETSRLVVRLSLVLDHLKRRDNADWRAMLHAVPVSQGASQSLRLTVDAWRMKDCLAFSAGLVVLGLGCLL